MADDKLAILQRIIDHLGDCETFASPSVCKRCPLGNKKVNGRRVNCADYLNINWETMTTDEINDTYEKAAEEELFRIEMEDFLSED